MSGPGGFAIKNFPLLLSHNIPPTVWNIHRINLERLPVINVNQTGQFDWINQHVSLALSDRERALRERASLSPVDVLVHVKDTLHCLFMRATEPNARRIFSFKDPSHGGIYTIIFLNNIRLDLASHTLIADTCVLPLTPKLVENFGQIIANITLGGKMIEIVTCEDEVRAWKHLLPAFAERCRTWSHKPMCQYNKTGDVPLSVKFDQNPICACGEGIQLGAFSKVPQWKKLAPFVTRAAISPLFAVSYLESVGGSVPSFDKMLKMASTSPVCTHCGVAAGTQKCSRCKDTNYCGQACQRADWKQHKVHCKVKQ